MIVAPRRPWPAYTGDRARTLLWIEALRSRAQVVVVGAFEGGSEGVEVITARWSPVALLRSLLRVFRDGLPFHSLLAGPYRWDEAIRRAGPVDCAVVLLSRTWPWVAPSLLADRKLPDAIDSAAAGMAQRASASRTLPSRWFWLHERAAAERLERRAAQDCDAVVVVSDDEASAFGARALAIPMGIEVVPLGEEPRDFDFGFWGRLKYFANESAARVLLDEIWPAIRQRKPSATLFIGGADAPKWLRRRNGGDGVTVVSPVGDRSQALRRVRIALLPITFGTGESMKTLEAAEAGCAIVGTPLAFRALPDLAAVAVVEPRLDRFADHAVSLLDDPRRRQLAGTELRKLVAESHSAGRARERLAGMALGEDS